YSIEARMLTSLGKIHNLIGQLQGYKTLTSNLQLRRTNRIKSLRSSLAIEGNTLSEDQIRAIINGKLVMGPRREILEVKNALETYELLDSIRSISEDDLLRAHKTLMKGLINDAGIYRQGGVGVVDGEKVIHIAPPFKRVPSLMGDLFDYLVNYEEEIVLKSCVFHYEFEFIHPFSDGNGRMGRLWQTLILKEAYPLLEFVPFEILNFYKKAFGKPISKTPGLQNPIFCTVWKRGQNY
ncbi:MAG: Fic family protein, partial [Bacteroidota bacterium]